MKISIIIPALNEAETIGSLLRYLKANSQNLVQEIIVCDGGSADDTLFLAEQAGAITIKTEQKGRALQMNSGASLAEGDILYFVHADTLPPKTYATDIIEAVEQGYDLGRYLSVYQSNSQLLKINSFLSRFDTFEGMGGDQTLFITKTLFSETGGYDSRMKIMEEFEFCARARKNKRYKIMKKAVLISARKYETSSWFKIQKLNYSIVKMYKAGASQESMVQKYKQINNRY
ncbi:MAG: TIGR04283 family arsenosugar biosynthesis glycosyltransferase [Pyrinomonadaceae bacterium]|nr:TIGR04283 family arsenosugar biosynthesis glycosyltransferase [Sphingobacteriaceae bacterium]